MTKVHLSLSLLAALVLVAAGSAGEGPYPRPELLLEPAELAKPEVARQFVVLDARDGSVFEKVVEDEDHSAEARTCRVALADAIESALRQGKGNGKVTPVEAEIELVAGEAVVTVRLFDGAKASVVRIDGAKDVGGAEAAPAAPAAPERPDVVRQAQPDRRRQRQAAGRRAHAEDLGVRPPAPVDERLIGGDRQRLGQQRADGDGRDAGGSGTAEGAGDHSGWAPTADGCDG